MKQHWNCFPSLCLGFFFLQNFPCESFLRQRFAIVLRISCNINKNTFRSFKNKPRTRSKRLYNNSCSRLRAKSHKSEIEISFDLFSAFKLFTTFSCSAQNRSADDDEDVHNKRLKSMICFLFIYFSVKFKEMKETWMKTIFSSARLQRGFMWLYSLCKIISSRNFRQME